MEWKENEKIYLSSLDAQVGQVAPKNETSAQVKIDWKEKFSTVISEIKQTELKLKIVMEALEGEWSSNGIPGSSLLHATAYYRNVTLTRILVSMGYDVNTVGSHGYTPLEHCLNNNSDNALEIMKFLLEHHKQSDKYTLFHLCTKNKPPDWIQVFYCLLQHLSNGELGNAWALEVAKRNLSDEEFIELKTYLQVKQNEDNERNVQDVMLSVQEENASEDKVSVELKEPIEFKQPQTFLCSKCKIGFKTSQQQLQQHNIRKHNAKKIFTCHLCGHILKTTIGYNIHLATHSNEKLFLCHICGKRFSASGSLHKHIFVFHTGMRPFVCRYCSKTFPLKYTLKEHLKTHDEAASARPFGCNVCGSRYQFKKGLARHKKMHLNEDERPKFCCETCQRTFLRSDHLERHIIKVHPS